jgi:tRNA A37 threonylcarbamoyladenosine synthetase subunit TsaC/SUA5/YrdC
VAYALNALAEASLDMPLTVILSPWRNVPVCHTVSRRYNLGIRMLGWSHQLAMNEKCTDPMAEKSSLDMKTTIGPSPAEERST